MKGRTGLKGGDMREPEGVRGGMRVTRVREEREEGRGGRGENKNVKKIWDEDKGWRGR